MKLYDETIRACRKLLEEAGARALPLGDGGWPDVSDRSMILRSDMAYELGSGQLPAVGATIVTANEALVPADALSLIGSDLPEIRQDSPYARVALVRVREDTLGEALSRGLDFTKTGNRMISAFHKNPAVEAVSLTYVTEQEFDYRALLGYVKEAEEITKTIDHILKNVMMDCTACSLQKVCDEVEGLRELHFSNKE